MTIQAELLALQRARNLARTARYICQNKHQREFFRDYLEYQEQNSLPNKASSFKQFIKHWETLGREVPYTKDYLKSKMMHLLKALDNGESYAEPTVE